MKKLLLIALLSIPSLLFAQKITPYVCSYSVDEVEYEADELVVRRFVNLEQQILGCEASGVQVVVANPKKVKLDFDFMTKKDKKMVKVPENQIPPACAEVTRKLDDWNSSIQRLLDSEIVHPISILLTIKSIEQTIRENEIPKGSDGNLKAWKFFRDTYTSLILEEFDYASALITKEKSKALELDEDLAEIEVSNDDLEDPEVMADLVSKIQAEKTFDAVVGGRSCDVMEAPKNTVTDLPEQQEFKLPEKEKKEKEPKDKKPPKNNNTNNQPPLNNNNQQPNNNQPPVTNTVDGTWNGDAEGVAVSVTVSNNTVTEIVYGSDMVDGNPGTVNVDGVNHTVEVKVLSDKIEVIVDGKSVAVAK